MKNCKKYITSILPANFLKALILLQLVYSQLHGQNNLPVAIENNFRQYSAAHPVEKIYVHMDKGTYISGEKLWYKIYLTDAKTGQQESFDNIVYTELRDVTGQVVLHAVVNSTKGSGNGYFSLPVTMNTGSYLFTAYTSWMKNSGEEGYFSQVITVFNTLTTSSIDSTKNLNADYLVRFFPEGGNLVFGLTSKVAFEMLNSSGRPVNNFEGIILDGANDTVVHFQPLKSGIGSFLFTPKPGYQYRTIIKTKDQPFNVKLPEIYNNGYVMMLTSYEDKVSVSVKAAGDVTKKPVTLFIHSGKKVSLAMESAFNERGETFFTIDRRQLETGISHFTLFTADKLPVCERLYFKHPGPEETKVDLIPIKSNYAAREKVSIRIDFNNHVASEEQADASLSVYLLDSLESYSQQSIETYLLLVSELKGNIEDANYYLQNHADTAKQALDNLLLSHGWSRYKWTDIFNNTQPAYRFFPEIYGRNLHVKVSRQNGTVSPGINVWLSVPGNDFIFLNATSDKEGSCHFVLPKLSGRNEMVLQTEKDYKIEVINSPVTPLAIKVTAPALCLSCPGWLLPRSIAMQVENSYRVTEKNKAIPLFKNDTTPFYGRPDKQYNLDDYTRFLTMEEVIKEFVKEVDARKQSGSTSYYIKDRAFSKFFDNEALVLMDGLPVFNHKKIMEINPLKVKSIDVVAAKFYTGPSVNDGVLSFRTYTGDLGGLELDPNAIVLDYEGLQLQQDFYSPVYETEEQSRSHFPDLRTTLKWEPKLALNSRHKNEVEFFTSDYPGSYLILLQGITQTGKPITASVIIQVLNPQIGN